MVQIKSDLTFYYIIMNKIVDKMESNVLFKCKEFSNFNMNSFSRIFCIHCYSNLPIKQTCPFINFRFGKFFYPLSSY